MPKALLAMYICLVPVNFDHVIYGPGQDAGDELELSDAQAKQLLEVNAIKLKGKEADVVGETGNTEQVTKTAATAPAAKTTSKK